MTDLSREQVILFWDMMDELLNAVLFLLMGFALLSVEISVRSADRRGGRGRAGSGDAADQRGDAHHPGASARSCQSFAVSPC